NIAAMLQYCRLQCNIAEILQKCKLTICLQNVSNMPVIFHKHCKTVILSLLQ
ncbi:hypothetical protein ALC57_13202, partial [Trachymyrmex cornetzi]